MKVVWKEMILAQSDEGIVVEGNYYFPPDSLNREYFRESTHSTICPWKGTANYYDVVVIGDAQEEAVIANAAWYYPQPKSAAAEITDYVAFYRNRVDVVEG
jgi:uncharacterized protein (DUF427 family)